MPKYVLLVGGLLILLTSGITLYTAYAPRVDPIGNGPNDQLIRILFISQLVSGLCSVTLSVLLFRQGK